MLAFLVTMLASTRLAITMRDVAGPQASPAVVQSESFAHLTCVMRHMREAVVAVLPALQRSPALGATQLLVGSGPQVLAGPTHGLVSMQGLLACVTVQE